METSLERKVYTAFRGLSDFANDGQGTVLFRPAVVIYNGLPQSEKIRILLSLHENQRKVIRAVLPHLFYSVEN